MATQRWNWQSPDWPEFTYDAAPFAALERRFIHNAGVLQGMVKHTAREAYDTLRINMLSDEAFNTSEIEGVVLDRASLQSSIRHKLGLGPANRRASPAESGVAELIVDIERDFSSPLTHQRLFQWHAMVCSGRRDLEVVGGYRTHADPMQIVSNRLDVDQPQVHFEAPPSSMVTDMMVVYLDWYRRSGPGGEQYLSPLVRAGMAHFYFLCIHPFEDGNGRIARALSEKSLSEDIGKPVFVSLSRVIQGDKAQYYRLLQEHNHTLQISRWLIYFANVVLEAQENAIATVEFLISKTRFYDAFEDQMNERQHKVVARLFAAGTQGFDGGLSAKNYRSITKASSATASRDLRDLVDKGVLRVTGTLKSTRYWLNLDA